MTTRHGQLIEIESLADFETRVAAGARSLSGWRLQDLDLSGQADSLARLDPAGALFLGCRFAPGTEADLLGRGAIIFPAVPQAPFAQWRVDLYSPTDLYDDPDYADCFDARVYGWSRSVEPSDQAAVLAQTLHDRSIDEALTEWIAGRRLVGVMGGHAAERGSADYRAAAELGHLLADRATVATGGGPGAMEAANLGAWLRDPTDLPEALAMLGAAPSFRPDVGPWVTAARQVLARWPGGRPSLGVPTWFYGHEPPNPFATAIAKYFRNATREAILLQICDAGIVFLPGAGGTVQEIFQDACENYYADESSVAPMVLVGVDYWTRYFPAWPLLTALAAGRAMEDQVHLVDSVAEAAALIGGSTQQPTQPTQPTR